MIISFIPAVVLVFLKIKKWREHGMTASRKTDEILLGSN
jgi:hypothetical protein